jgi:hypothetical protein
VVKSSVVQSAHWGGFAAELIGTAVLVGLSLVIRTFGAGSPIVGEVSAAHITLAVRMELTKRCPFDNARGLFQLIHSPKLGRG